MRQSVIAVVVGLAAVWGVTAQASTYTDHNNNPAVVEAYSGSNPVSWSGFSGKTYGGGEWGSNIGGPPNDPYITTGLTITWVGDTINIVFNTDFSGVDNRLSPSVYAADIFITSGGGAQPGAFNYAIALGYDSTTDGSKDGGETKTGLYSVGSYKTSQSIWSKSGDIYGGQFTLASDAAKGPCTTGKNGKCPDAEAAPTVLTSGTMLAGVSETSVFTAGVDGNTGTMDVTLTANGQTGLNSLEQVFGGPNGFDIFWGTGDCSNAPIFAQVPDFGPEMSVPEPGSVALLGSALLCFMMLRRRRPVHA